MKTAFLLLLVLTALLLVVQTAPPALAEPFGPGQTFNQKLVADVTATALAFMAPRTLEPFSLSQMTLWGLRGLVTLDPRLTPDLHDNTLTLGAPPRLLFARPPPAETDAAGWGEAVAQMSRAAWDASDLVRRAGTLGVLRSFFDELFNHFDPYSRYAPPEEAAEDRDRRDGRGGIGVRLARQGGGFVIQSVLDDSPASQAGLRPGERILAIDGDSTQGEDQQSVEELLGGPEDTPVSLLLRGRDGHTRAIEIIRALITAPTVTASRQGTALVLRISGFSSDTGAKLAREMARGLAGAHPPRGVVLDLRGNRGGLLREAVAAAQTLLETGIVASTAGRDPAAAHEFMAVGEDLAHGQPVVVVVDGRTASSAEILAAALADQHRAVVVGSSTLGKGVVQTVAPLADGGELYVTWSRVLAPLGWPIQGLGVLPQVCTSTGQAATARALADLQAGQQPMERALARERNARAPLPAAEILEIRNACPAAEGRDGDMTTARFLIDHPPAYAAALLGPPDDTAPGGAKASR